MLLDRLPVVELPEPLLMARHLPVRAADFRQVVRGANVEFAAPDVFLGFGDRMPVLRYRKLLQPVGFRIEIRRKRPADEDWTKPGKTAREVLFRGAPCIGQPARRSTASTFVHLE